MSLSDRQKDALTEAVMEARRFIHTAEAAIREQKNNRWGVVYSAASKRASLDLTRALARFRSAP